MNITTLPAPPIAPATGSQSSDELSLDDLECVVGGLSRPLSIEPTDVEAELAAAVAGLPGKEPGR